MPGSPNKLIVNSLIQTLQHKDQKLYEAAYLISPAYSEEEALAFQQSLKNEVQELGGIIDHEGEVLINSLKYYIY